MHLELRQLLRTDSLRLHRVCSELRELHLERDRHLRVVAILHRIHIAVDWRQNQFVCRWELRLRYRLSVDLHELQRDILAHGVEHLLSQLSGEPIA